MYASRRSARLPHYVVNELATVRHKLAAAGVDVIDLSAGDLDLDPPELAVRALREALADPRMSRYSFQVGLLEFREAIARYMARRFGVTVDPVSEVLPLMGAKDGLSHFPLALLDPGDMCIVPESGYPAYAGGAILADARLETVSLESRNGFLLEMSDLPLDRLECARLVFLNYPNNPTAAVAPLDFLQRTVGLCKSHRIALAYDNPYCEITYDGYVAPSVLEVSGARDVTVEFHSLSKSACMTGWRLGWAVGSAELIALLSKVKSYVDAGPFLAVQQAGAKVLDSLESVVQPVRTCLAKRRDAAVEAFDRAGFKVDRPKAGMYLWLRVPARVPSSSFARDVLEHEGVAIMPGSAFGESCDEYVRIALTVAPERLIEAAERLGRALAGLEAAGASA